MQTPLAVLLMAFLDTAALTYAILCARTGGWKLAGGVALLFFGVKSFLVLIEAVYLSDLLPPALVRTLLLNGIITAVLFSLAAVQLHDRWAAREPVSTPLTLSMLGWLWRLALTGILWVLIFVAAGLLVFRPVAMTLDSVVASEYLASFASESPGLILLFQAGRSVLWALLTLPLTQVVNGRRWKTGLAISSLYAVLMGSSLLLPNEALPASIQLAHLAEVITANFIFGWVITWLWTQRVSQRHVEAMASPSVMPLR